MDDIKSKPDESCSELAPPTIPINIKVTATTKNGATAFEPSGEDPPSSGYLKGRDLDFPNGPPRFRIMFRLDDQTGKGLKFASQPISISETHACGTMPLGIDTDQVFDVCANGNRLTLINTNSRVCRLNYQLNFVDGQGQPDPWDPVIINGGGGSQR